MNLYIRFFDREILATSVAEALEFLQSIPEIGLDEYMASDIAQYVASDVLYPKRYKVRGRAYFIVIKTPVNTLEEFKSIGTLNRDTMAKSEPKDKIQEIFLQQNLGWYEGTINFKRVVPIPGTVKFQYCDTVFRARVRASCVQECYDRIIDHLRARGDIDPRSQFPSIKGKHFTCDFLGQNPS